MPKQEKFNVSSNPKTMIYVMENDTICLRCNRCDHVVLRETNPAKDGAPYQCMHCDISLSDAEVHAGEPHTAAEMDDLCCDTRDLLLLDEH